MANFSSSLKLLQNAIRMQFQYSFPTASENSRFWSQWRNIKYTTNLSWMSSEITTEVIHTKKRL